MEDKRLEATLRLLDIMDTLREKCPWDRKQTFESLRGNTIEETYELADAITDGNLEAIKEEAGDLLLHSVDKALWREDAENIEGFYTSIGERLPAKLWEELETLKKNLE